MDDLHVSGVQRFEMQIRKEDSVVLIQNVKQTNRVRDRFMSCLSSFKLSCIKTKLKLPHHRVCFTLCTHTDSVFKKHRGIISGFKLRNYEGNVIPPPYFCIFRQV